MIVFAVIFLYLVITMIRYAVKPKIKMYEVQDGDIASDSYYTGVILRTEQVVNSEYSGYVSYYLQEKGKAAVGNLVFAVDENGAVNDYLNKTAGSESRLTEANLKELKTQLSAFSSSYSDQTFSRIYDLNNSMSSRLLEYLNINMLTELGATGEDLSLPERICKGKRDRGLFHRWNGTACCRSDHRRYLFKGTLSENRIQHRSASCERVSSL